MSAQFHDMNLLAGYLDGRLTSAEHLQFTEHLAACAECRGTLALYVRAATERSSEMPRPGRPRWSDVRVWLPVAAMLAVSAGAVVSVVRLSDVQPLQRDAAAPAPSPQPGEATGTAPAVVPPVADPGTQTPPRDTSATALGPLRSGERRIGRKTFRLVAGEWVDAQYDPIELLPVVRVASAQERAALLQRVPALRRYAGLGPRVLVVHEGTVYRINPARQ